MVKLLQTIREIMTILIHKQETKGLSNDWYQVNFNLVTNYFKSNPIRAICLNEASNA